MMTYEVHLMQMCSVYSVAKMACIIRWRSMILRSNNGNIEIEELNQ